MLRTPPTLPGRRRATVAVTVAISLTALVAIAAIALDGGILLSERRHAQATADAAALAAAADLFAHYPTNAGLDPSGTAAQSALHTAAANGYANDGTTSVVTVNIPPTSGTFTGQAGYAEVIVQWNQARSFSNIFASGPIPVRARAVARGQWKAAANGILMLDPHAVDALKITGNGSLSVTGGASVIVNSDAGEAAVLSASGGVTAASPGKVYITGGWSVQGSGTFSPAPVHAAPTPDPLRFLPAVDPSTLPVRTFPSSGGIIYPGRYIGQCQLSSGGNLVLAGEGTPDPNNGNQPIPAGQAIYYFDGGPVAISSNGNVSSSGGVMIYFAPSSPSNVFDLSANGSLNITPLTAGTYAGMSYFQARGTTAAFQVTANGSASSTFSGTFYAPNAPVLLTANGSLTTSQLICGTLELSANGSSLNNFNGPKLPVRFLQLVE